MATTSSVINTGYGIVPFGNPTNDSTFDASAQATLSKVSEVFSCYHTFTVSGDCYDYPAELQLTPDGKTAVVIVQGERFEFKTYDIQSRQELWTCVIPASFDRFRITPDGTKIIAYQGNRATDELIPQGLKIMDLKTGKILVEGVQDKTHIKISSSKQSVQISSDGKSLYITSRWGARVQVLNLNTGEFIESFAPKVMGGAVKHISPDGITAISSLSTGQLIIWNLQTGKILQTLAGHPEKTSKWVDIPIVEVSDDGTMAISSAGWDLKVWNLATGECIKEFGDIRQVADSKKLGAYHSPYSWCRSIYHMRITPDNKRVLFGERDGVIDFFDLESGSRERIKREHLGAITCLQISPDGTGFVSGSMDKTIRLWKFAVPFVQENLPALNVGRKIFVQEKKTG